MIRATRREGLYSRVICSAARWQAFQPSALITTRLSSCVFRLRGRPHLARLALRTVFGSVHPRHVPLHRDSRLWGGGESPVSGAERTGLEWSGSDER